MSSVERGHWMSYRLIDRGDGSRMRMSNRYELVTRVTPRVEDVVEAQSAMGFDPRGYGQPWGVVSEDRAPGVVVTTWFSMASAE